LKFEKVLYEVSEILHEEITDSKSNLFTQPEFKKISMSQWCYLEAIYALGSPTYTQLAEKLKYTKASVSISIKKLIDKGYVKKDKSPEDQRASIISLTEKGVLAVGQHIEAHLEFARNLQKYLSDEQVESLIEISEVIIKNFKR